MIDVKASAAIERGKKTNRVKVKRSPGSVKAALARGDALPPTRLTVPCRGPYVQVCLSLGLDDLADLDAKAEAAGLERSAFVRRLIAGATP